MVFSSLQKAGGISRRVQQYFGGHSRVKIGSKYQIEIPPALILG